MPEHSIFCLTAENNITEDKRLEGKGSMKKYLFAFGLGFVIYPVIEIMFRGYTHISMAVTGGAAVSALYAYHNRQSSVGIWGKSLIGSLIITGIELIAGVIVNMVFKLNVWDYSNCPLNLWGQICLPFSVAWFFLAMLFFLLCPYIDRLIKRRDKIY